MKHEEAKDRKNKTGRTPAGHTSEVNTENPHNNKEADTGLSRRGFIKGAAIAGVSLTASGMVAKKVVETANYATPQERGMQDELSGDRALSSRRYFLTTEEDKKSLVRFFIKNYKEEL